MTSGAQDGASYHARVPSDLPFVLVGGNAENVVGHPALAELSAGRYVEIGAASPSESAVPRAFYDRGWNGITVASSAEGAAAFRRERPRDVVLQNDGRPLDALLGEHLPAGDELDLLVLHGPRSGTTVAAEVDLRRLRPSVLVVPAVSPARVEEAGAADELADLRRARDDALAEVARWRGEVLARWSAVVGAPVDASAGRGSHEIVRLKAELAAMQSTVSWRVTAPLRAFQHRRLREWR